MKYIGFALREVKGAKGASVDRRRCFRSYAKPATSCPSSSIRCNEADAARGREGRPKGDEKAEWWLQDHVGVLSNPRIVSHLGSLKASPGAPGQG